jgi:hypothetical protein
MPMRGKQSLSGTPPSMCIASRPSFGVRPRELALLGIIGIIGIIGEGRWP